MPNDSNILDDHSPLERLVRLKERKRALERKVAQNERKLRKMLSDPPPPPRILGLMGKLALAATLLGSASDVMAAPRRGTASYYTVESAIREGTCTNPAQHVCLQANGRPLNDEAFTAASWDYRLGTSLEICRAVAGVHHAQRLHCVEAVVTDRGPARYLHQKGRIIDLSQAAFAQLAPLSEGIIQVTVEVLP